VSINGFSAHVPELFSPRHEQRRHSDSDRTAFRVKVRNPEHYRGGRISGCETAGWVAGVLSPCSLATAALARWSWSVSGRRLVHRTVSAKAWLLKRKIRNAP